MWLIVCVLHVVYISGFLATLSRHLLSLQVYPWLVKGKPLSLLTSNYIYSLPLATRTLLLQVSTLQA